MKKNEFIAGLLLLCGVAMFSSCMKDEIIESSIESDLELRFTTSQAYRDQFRDESGATRSGAAEVKETTMSAITEVSGDESLERPLYLHMSGKKMAAPSRDEVDAAFGKTRSAITTSENIISVHGTRGLGIFAYVYKPGEWDSKNTTSAYVHNLPAVYYTTASKIKDGVVLESKDCNYWALNNPVTSYSQYHWPGVNYDIRIYAYAPYAGKNSDNEGNVYADDIITIPDDLYKGAPVIDYMVYEENRYESSKNQPLHPDFIVAGTGNLKGNTNTTQPLSFKHALSCVSFAVGKGMPAGKITKIEFQNIYKGGSINLEYATDNDLQTKAWEVDTDTQGSVYLEKEIPVKAEGEKLTEESDNFMMLPQTLPDDALLVVTMVDEAGNPLPTLEGKIGGYQWDMGYHYIYTLDKDSITQEYVFDVDNTTLTARSNQLEDTYLGGAKTSWNIQSYKRTVSSLHGETTTPIRWQAQMLEDGKWVDLDVKPEIFSKFICADEGSVMAMPYDAEIAPIIPDDPLNPFVNKEDREEGSSVVNLYDNNCGNKWWSSNCYVINKAGYYRFPVVYGNAIKGANINSQAYAGCVDYKGVEIQSPFIHNSGTLGSAKLLWCDAPQLVTEVELSGTNETMKCASTPVRYITFRVPGASIAPGNAVIALYDTNGKIMWSWHIWVTKWSGGSVSVTSNSKSFNFATEILGYCPARNATWNQREVKVRFKQVDSNKVSETYLFKQGGETIQYSEGTMPYYQWGRKDPMLPYNYITNANGTATGGKEKDCYGLPLTQRNDMFVYDTSVYNPDTGKYGMYVPYTYIGYFPVAYKVGSAQTNGAAMWESIQNPHTFYARHTKSGSAKGDGVEYDWCNKASYNRWDATNQANIATGSAHTELATVKTIYDPCPAGWCVPPVGAFYGVTEEGGATTKSPSKTTLNSNDVTPAFQVTAKGGNVVKLPVAGDRNRYNGAPWWNVNEARSVQLWTSTPAVKNAATCAYFAKSGDNHFVTLSSGPLGKSSGFAVLPVKEH